MVCNCDTPWTFLLLFFASLKYSTIKMLNFMRRNTRQHTFGHLQRCSRSQSESTVDAYWIDKDAKSFHAENGMSGQTAQMCRLICVFFGRTYQTVQTVT